MTRTTACLALGLWLLLSGCASDWKIHGGPEECVQMCAGWNMRMTGMVGVGNQDATGAGATACVCEVPTAGGYAPVAPAPAVAPPAAPQPAAAAQPVATSGISASTGAVIVALQEAERQEREQRERLQRPSGLRAR